MEEIEKDWFKVKRYPHIGFPVDGSQRFKWIEAYVTNTAKIARHGFLPFIHKTSDERRFRKVYDDLTGKPDQKFMDGNKHLRTPSKKPRELYYASHIDSLIYSFYARELNREYRELLNSTRYNLSEVVTAYRSIPVRKVKGSPSKCNIDFANDVFRYISDYKEDEFTVVAFDIKSFFNNLDHKYLRLRWMETLGVDKLPPDHFNVFKNITRFSFVEIDDLFNEFQDRIYTQRRDKSGEKLAVKKKRVSHIRFLRNQNAIAFCSEKEFFQVKRRLIKTNKTETQSDGTVVPRKFGIPQGSPISSVLANIYLLHFDKAINDFVSGVGGIYRRYSDDIVVICPSEAEKDLLKLVNDEIIDCKLTIQSKKTQVFIFKRENDKLSCGQRFKSQINWNKKFVYLGFEFDGENVLIKSASISRYYRKMKRYVKRSKMYSIASGKSLFKRRIYRKYSYLGAKRFKKYIWNEREQKFVKSEISNWGNFLSYSSKASNVIGGVKIKNQTKRHWKILNDLLTK